MAIQPHLPRGRRRVRRADDHRVISGIMHMLRSGGRWKDCPAVYGPYTTIYNRWNRWSRQGVWQGIFYTLTGSTGVFTGAVDSTHIKITARRHAIGASRGRTTKNPCIDRRYGASCRLRPHA